MNIPTFLNVAGISMRHSRINSHKVFVAHLRGNISFPFFSYGANCPTSDVPQCLDFQFQNQLITLKYLNILFKVITWPRWEES